MPSLRQQPITISIKPICTTTCWLASLFFVVIRDMVSSIINKARQALLIAAESGPIDLLLAIYYVHLIKKPNKYVSKVFCPELNSHVYMRRFTSDKYCLPHIVRELEYRHLLGFNNPSVIIDFGANVGYTSLWLKKQYPDARIIAVEPDIENFNMLQANVQLNKCQNVTVINAGIGDKAGYLIEVPANHKDMWMIEYQYSEVYVPNAVPVVTIHGIMKEYDISTIDILKVDVEGSEKHLLLDKSIQWNQIVHRLAIETHMSVTYGDTGPLLDDMLAEIPHLRRHFSQTTTIDFV
jgi:FkbM family methyltransferase